MVNQIRSWFAEEPLASWELGKSDLDIQGEGEAKGGEECSEPAKYTRGTMTA